jgi:predicted nucleic acid-binding protein
MILLDTDVLVDVARGYPPAVTWLSSLDTELIGVPGLVAMEMLQGCRDLLEQRRAVNLLNPYVLYWPSRDDCDNAFQDFATYHLSHGLGMLDALIGETAAGLDVEIATFNERHYHVLSRLKTLHPYTRTAEPQ